ncbi:hypothetical protein JTB14_003696 [Gonioctena quinquepunctata]|nr:hypothetical protein JTB14_003696 [Gonioctena quinquepunctata]
MIDHRERLKTREEPAEFQPRAEAYVKDKTAARSKTRPRYKKKEVIKDLGTKIEITKNKLVHKSQLQKPKALSSFPQGNEPDGTIPSCSHSSSHTLPKRGLLNIVGKASKCLSGTLDSDDEVGYNQIIQKLQQNQNSISKEITRSLSKKRIDNYNATTTTFLDADQKIIKDRLEYFQDNVNQSLSDIIGYLKAPNTIDQMLQNEGRTEDKDNADGKESGEVTVTEEIANGCQLKPKKAKSVKRKFTCHQILTKRWTKLIRPLKILQTHRYLLHISIPCMENSLLQN